MYVVKLTEKLRVNVDSADGEEHENEANWRLHGGLEF